ncbi:AsmA-like C-terminal region-containing protein [Alphaproteobacteria bacterium]|nr:AsmA-like C-terminal region-containing protein [Alphaproteobacteria bacterium]
MLLRRTNKLVIEFLGGFMVLMLLLMALLYARLSTGPMSIEWAGGLIGAIASHNLNGGQVDISGAQIGFSEDEGAFQVRIDRADYRSKDDYLFTVNQIVFEPDMARLVASLSLSPRSVQINEISVSAKRDTQDARSLYLAGLREAAEFMSALPIGRGLGDFKFLRVENISLNYQGQDNKVERPKSYIIFERDNDLIKTDVRILYRGADGNASAIANGDLKIGQPGDIDLSLNNIRLNELAEIMPILAPLSGQSAPIHIEGKLALDEKQSLIGANLLAEFGAGKLLFGERLVVLKNLTSRVDIDVVQKSIFLSEGALAFDHYDATFSGAFSYKTNSGGAVALIDGSILSDRFSMSATSDRPQWNSNNSIIEFAYNVDDKKLMLGRGETELAGMPISTRGVIDFNADDPHLDLSVQLGKTSIDNVIFVWPEYFAPRTRGWVRQNISGGTIEGGAFRIEGQASEFRAYGLKQLPEKDLFSGSVDLKNTRMRYSKEMPEMIISKGRLETTSRQFSAIVEAGYVDVMTNIVSNESDPDEAQSDGDDNENASERQIIRNGLFVAPEYFDLKSSARVSFDIDGQITPILKLINMPPLRALQKSQFSPSDFEGTVNGSVAMQFPLMRKLNRDEVQFDITASSSNARLTRAVSGYLVKEGDLNIRVSPQGMSVSGEAQINNVPMKASLSLPLWRSSVNNLMTLSGKFNATPQALQNLRLKVLSSHVKGDAPATFDMTFARSGSKAIVFDVDLTKTQVQPKRINYLKPSGLEASIRGNISMDPSGVIVSFSTEYKAGKNDHVLVKLEAPNGIVKSMLVSPARLGENYDATLETIIDGNITNFILRGNVIDVSRLFGTRPLDASLDVVDAADSLTKDTSRIVSPSDIPENAKPIVSMPELPQGYNADIRVARLPGAQNEVFGSVQLSLIRVSGRMEKGTIAANLTNGAEVYGELFRDNELERRFLFQSEDGSQILRALDLVPGMTGGAFSLSGTIFDAPIKKDGKTISGEASFAFGEYKLTNVPLLAQLLTLASFTGLSDTISGSGIRFDKTDGRLSWHQWRMYIDEGLASGNSLGISFQGAIDRTTNRISIGGAMVPAYGLNTLLGRIPFIGGVFSGRKGEGLIGVSYRIYGKASKPSVFINPVSIITPGFTRRLFDLGTGDLGYQ